MIIIGDETFSELFEELAFLRVQVDLHIALAIGLGAVGHVRVVRLILIMILLLALICNVLVPLAPRFVLVCTAAGEDINLGGFDRVLARLEGLLRSVAGDQVLIKMAGKLFANLV